MKIENFCRSYNLGSCSVDFFELLTNNYEGFFTMGTETFNQLLAHPSIRPYKFDGCRTSYENGVLKIGHNLVITRNEI